VVGRGATASTTATCALPTGATALRITGTTTSGSVAPSDFLQGFSGFWNGV